MIDSNTYASALYGGPAPEVQAAPQASAQSAPQPVAAPESVQAEHPLDTQERLASIYDKAPMPMPDEHPDPEMQAIRQSAERRMFGDAEAVQAIPDDRFASTIGQQIEVEVEREVEVEDEDGNVTKQLTKSTKTIEITPALVQKATVELRAAVADLGMSREEVALVAQGIQRAQQNAGNADVVIASRERAVDLLNAEHGPLAAKALAAARSYVAKNPRVAAVLDRTGAGDDAQVVALIARRALALHRAGKLTLK